MSTPGDVGWIVQHDFASWWIRWAQQRKYGKHAPEARYNHCFLVVGTAGEIIEADPSGIALGNLSEYAGTEMVLRTPPYAPGDAAVAVAAAHELLDAGDRYGFLVMGSLAVAMLTGTKLRIGIKGTQVCSGAVSYEVTRANIDVGQDEEYNTPADVMHVAGAQAWAVGSP